jgi:ditrans,polycis-polyprenyl diphosphate synthase
MPVPTFVQRLSETTLDRLQCALLTVLRAGPIPQHVAFVMDGNRRYARNKGMKVIQGHVDGFVALRRVRLSHFFLLPRPAITLKILLLVGTNSTYRRQVLEICSVLGVKFVTVYAFAIDNFKRPKEEVDGLMRLAEKGLLELCTRGCVICSAVLRSFVKRASAHQ